MAEIPIALIKKQVLLISFCSHYVVQYIFTMFDWNFISHNAYIYGEKHEFSDLSHHSMVIIQFGVFEHIFQP